GDDTIVPVTSREDLRNQLAGRNSGGVFLTTIHKFTEDTELLSERNNIICISDDQLSAQMCNAKNYIGDDTIVPVTSREDLRNQLAGRNSGGVFLTTIHK
ncbi:hypothetical protein, partial [Enterobacter hormaechei]|uniref:hypothetical protein n=1 Tax=Enterobacter hormaechei TaxID=158836 RepID=UPI001055B543